MNDEQMQRAVRSWLSESDPAPPDARQAVRRAMARMPQVRQRGRWWPLPTFERTPKPPTTDHTSESQPTSIPATNGLSATVTGRTRSMFSPAKASIAGAVIFALGGLLLIAQPFGHQGSSFPGAATDTEPDPAAVTPPTEVSGHIECGPEVLSGTYESMSLPLTDDQTLLVGQTRGYAWQPTATMSDPRLEGTYLAYRERGGCLARLVHEPRLQR